MSKVREKKNAMCNCLREFLKSKGRSSTLKNDNRKPGHSDSKNKINGTVIC